MKMATSELGKSLYELGMEIQGPYGPVTDAERGEEHGRWVNAFCDTYAAHASVITTMNTPMTAQPIAFTIRVVQGKVPGVAGHSSEAP